MEEAQKEGKSSRGMYMCNIAGITPKWKDIRIADIIPNGCYLCSDADIPKLYEIALVMNIISLDNTLKT